MFSPRKPPQYLDSDRHADYKKSAFSKTAFHKLVTELKPTQPQTIYCRDGEVVIYRRSRSLLYQCRYKLSDGSWVRQSTGKASVEQAIVRACEIYDEARFRQRLGLSHRTHSVAQIAAETAAALRREIDAKWHSPKSVDI